MILQIFYYFILLVISEVKKYKQIRYQNIKRYTKSWLKYLSSKVTSLNYEWMLVAKRSLQIGNGQFGQHVKEVKKK